MAWRTSVGDLPGGGSRLDGHRQLLIPKDCLKSLSSSGGDGQG